MSGQFAVEKLSGLSQYFTGLGINYVFGSGSTKSTFLQFDELFIAFHYWLHEDAALGSAVGFADDNVLSNVNETGGSGNPSRLFSERCLQDPYGRRRRR